MQGPPFDVGRLVIIIRVDVRPQGFLQLIRSRLRFPGYPSNIDIDKALKRLAEIGDKWNGRPMKSCGRLGPMLPCLAAPLAEVCRSTFRFLLSLSAFLEPSVTGPLSPFGEFCGWYSTGRFRAQLHCNQFGSDASFPFTRSVLTSYATSEVSIHNANIIVPWLCTPGQSQTHHSLG